MRRLRALVTPRATVYYAEEVPCSCSELREALEDIERYAYDAIRDGHPSIPEMTRVQNKAMRALRAASAGDEDG